MNPAIPLLWFRWGWVCGALRGSGARALLTWGLLLQSVFGDRIHEDFSTSPLGTGGWRVEGDASHFVWDADRQKLSVLWDSSRPNAYFLSPLPTILTRAESFRFRLRLVLESLETLSPESTFQIGFGLLRRADATSSTFFRGAGIHPAWGPRNLVEFNYFPPSASISATLSAVSVATNNTRWAMVNRFPFELEIGTEYLIEIVHDAGESKLRLKVHRNGDVLAEGTTVLDARFGDFRLDAFSVSSYSGEHQPAGYGGQVLARGTVDEIEIEYPPAPRPKLDPPLPTLFPAFTLPTVQGWHPVLERGFVGQPWDSLPVRPTVVGDQWRFTDPSPPPAGAVYRIRMDRP